MRKTIMGLLIMALSLIGLVHAASFYEVGDANGWTTQMVVDYYKTWSSSKTFYVGDSLIFEYDKDFHNVMEVSFEDFETCNANSPLATYQSEYQQPVNLNRTGHYYFICGVPGHCEAGQKLDVLVSPVSLQNIPTVEPNNSFPNPNPNPNPNANPNPNPSPNNSASPSNPKPNPNPNPSPNNSASPSNPNPNPNPNPSPLSEDPLVVHTVDDATIASLPYNAALSPCVWSGLSMFSFILLQTLVFL